MPASLVPVARPVREFTSTFAADSAAARDATTPRDDILVESMTSDDGALVFTQSAGPFRDYTRTVTTRPDGAVEQQVRFDLDIPWFGMPFRWLVRRRLATGSRSETTPWWTPPDRLSADQVRLLGLLAMASLAAVFTNTLFTQTATFAGDSFGVDEAALGRAASIIRLGIIVAMPFTIFADRVGRRRMLVAAAWLAPILCALGAVAPTFGLLVATQTVGRPVGIALAILVAVVAAEEVPRNSRAFVLSLLSMAGALGATVAVANLWLADLGSEGWRLVYLLSLIWLVVAVSVQRHLPETRRFELLTDSASGVPAMRWRRFAMIGSVSVLSNVFVAPASFFQNEYLREVRGFNGTEIAAFVLLTATPGGLGLLLGGRLADAVGRRAVVITCLPLSTLALALSFATSGWKMFLGAVTGAVFAGFAYPALTVYRAELFPTGNRGRANGFITALALLGGVVGLELVGIGIDRGWTYGTAMSAVAVGQLLAAIVAFVGYPETAHLELEDLNPEDQASRLT
jgi:MFS family permease